MSWELIDEQALDSGGPHSEVNFQSLDLDNLYLLTGSRLKATSGGSTEAQCRFMIGAVEADHSLGFNNENVVGMELAVNTDRLASASTVGGYPVLGFADTYPLTDNNAAATNDIEGLNFSSLIWLYNKGSVDDHGPYFITNVHGTHVRISADVVLSGTHHGCLFNNDKPSIVDGVKVKASTGTFAAISGARIALYKYTGEVFI